MEKIILKIVKIKKTNNINIHKYVHIEIDVYFAIFFVLMSMVLLISMVKISKM